ncbi:MAG: alpha/beta hydrolase [Gammaproteobacteria bacterium]|nr:alpha/beta hydrolase [Gammaproteobacteria bacterium]MBT8443228.1 alpha/beta hydrolase [Gammaproteobacteria bacterium]NND37293.1 alpha/beta hydrolase [Gammaproteobacteria bacterium]
MQLYKTPEGRQKIIDWYETALARIDANVQSVWADTRFGRTHMLAAGPANGEPLFFLPGVAGAAPLFRRQLEGLSERFRVYAVDLPGQPGRSDPCPPSFLDNSFVDWFCDVLDSLGLESAHVGGQSAGGGIAMKIGIEAPDRTRSVFMFGPTGLARAHLPVKIWVTKVMANRHADALEQDLTAKSIRPKRTGESFGTYDRELARLMALATRNFRLDRALGISSEQTGRVHVGAGLRMLHKFFFAEKKAWLRQLKVPALLVFGEHELLVNPHKVARQAQKLIPHLRVEVVKNAGHGAIFDQPEIVGALLTDFIISARKSPSPAGPLHA